MDKKLKLMCILAHPDDETLGTGGTLAKYAAEGIETCVVTATRGQRGRFFDNSNRPSDAEVGVVREKELQEATKVLGVSELCVLDYLDAELDQADSHGAISKIVVQIRKFRPDVVITFDTTGAYGHPDHIAICQFATAACAASGDLSYQLHDNAKSDLQPHTVSKLYYITWSEPVWKAYTEAFRELTSTVDGVVRKVGPYPDWQVTTKLDTQKHWKTVWNAVMCHKTQLAIYSKLAELSEEHHRAIWGSQEYYRVYSLVNGGRQRETDLFEGLR